MAFNFRLRWFQKLWDLKTQIQYCGFQFQTFSIESIAFLNTACCCLIISPGTSVQGDSRLFRSSYLNWSNNTIRQEIDSLAYGDSDPQRRGRQGFCEIPACIPGAVFACLTLESRRKAQSFQNFEYWLLPQIHLTRQVLVVHNSAFQSDFWENRAIKRTFWNVPIEPFVFVTRGPGHYRYNGT